MRSKSTGKINNCAVSEALGFIIIFGIMLTGIAMVTLYGYPALAQEQQNTNIRNMQRNMIVLQNDLKGLTYKNVPYQETMLQVAGGTMLIKKDGGVNSSFTIKIDGTEYSYNTGGILFISEDQTTNICLENGAVHTIFWSSPNGSAMLAEPRWFYDNTTTNKTFVMTFITMNATEDLAQTGIGTVSMKLVPTNEIPPIGISAKTVTVSYRADPKYNYNIAWRNYFNKTDLRMQYSGGDGFSSTFQLDSQIDTLVIKAYNVTVLSL